MIKKKSYSFEKTNYMLRPKKQIERKIMMELFQRIQGDNILPITEYNYIGMGSIFYYDFLLFHKYLHINNFISIDDKNTINRFEFNKPYDFIKFYNLTTTQYLEDKIIPSPALIWFDYDSKICDYDEESKTIIKKDYLFDDIRLMSTKLKPKDLVFITVDVTIPPGLEYKIAFKEAYSEYFPVEEYRAKSFDKDSYPYIVRKIILNRMAYVQAFLSVKFKHLCSFHYNDGTPMLTIGGLIDDDDVIQRRIFNIKYDFVKEDVDIFNINVPILTYKEKIHIDSKINKLSSIVNNPKLKDKKNILLKKMKFEIDSVEEMAGYLTYYKYYPQYYEGII